MVRFFNGFVKATAWIVQFFCFRTKTYYEDKAAQSKRIKGAAIIISNHRSVYDYAVFLFVFFWRTLRYQMAEVLFEKKFLGWFLRRMGGIYVDRNSADLAFLDKSEEILNKGGVVGIFPESRLPKEGEEAPLPFKSGAVYLAMRTGAPIVPVYTDGSYFNKKRARVVIGKSVDVAALWDKEKSEKQNLTDISELLRTKVKSLAGVIDGEKVEK